MAGRVLRDSRGRFNGSTGGFGRGRSRGKSGTGAGKVKGPKMSAKRGQLRQLTPTEKAYRLKTTLIGAGIGTVAMPGAGTVIGLAVGHHVGSTNIRSARSRRR
jgi:hypothetical protein